MTYNSKLKKYCVECIINKTYMSTSKSKVLNVDFPKMRFTYINKNLDTKKNVNANIVKYVYPVELSRAKLHNRKPRKRID